MRTSDGKKNDNGHFFQTAIYNLAHLHLLSISSLQYPSPTISLTHHATKQCPTPFHPPPRCSPSDARLRGPTNHHHSLPSWKKLLSETLWSKTAAVRPNNTLLATISQAHQLSKRRPNPSPIKSPNHLQRARGLACHSKVWQHDFPALPSGEKIPEFRKIRSKEMELHLKRPKPETSPYATPARNPNATYMLAAGLRSCRWRFAGRLFTTGELSCWRLRRRRERILSGNAWIRFWWG